VGTLALAVVILVVGLIVSWVGYTRTLRHERDLARQAQQAAEEREREAKRVTESLAGVFELANPSRAGDAELTARELLAQGEERLETELAGQPQRLAEVLEMIASSYIGLGVHAEAERVARRAVALLREHAGDGSSELASSLETLALAMRGQNETEGVPYLREALAILKAQPESDPLAVALVQVRLAEQLLLIGGSPDQIRALSRQAMETVRESGAEDSNTGLLTLEVSARVRGRDDPAEAARLYEEVVTRRRRLFGAGVGLAGALNNLAVARKRSGDLDGAASAYREALEILDQRVPEEHPNRLRLLQNYASVLEDHERYDEVEALLREVLELHQRALGANHWRVGADHLTGIGRFLIRRGRWQEAAEEARRGVEAYESALGADHSWTAAARGQYAACLYALGRKDEAEALAELSLSWLERLDSLPSTMRVMVSQLASYHRAAGFNAIAERLEGALERFDREAGDGQPG
jgi:tetratricopeptide (TPR) repeat protein